MTRGQRTNVKGAILWMVAILITLGSITLQQGYAQQADPTGCTLATLHGRYVFDATGYNIVNGSAVPKTVAEFLTFNGDGSLTTIGTAVVGVTVVAKHPGTGTYIVNDDCTGTLTFDGSGFTFDLYIARNGGSFDMIQTVTGQMIAGTARKVH